MAAVYKAYQANMDRYVALKTLPRHFSSDPNYLGRFEQEAKVLAKLQHPHILPVHDFGETDGYTYIVMPFIKSGTLADLLLDKPLPVSQTHRIIRQVGDALDYAHSLGLIHRDVKPSNILVDERGNCLLTDFGIAKIVEGTSKFTATGGIIGTPAYMSPEQGSGEQVDNRSDIYALGVVLYEIATGRPPFDAETPIAIIFKHINATLPPPSKLNPDLPEDIERIILKSMAKNPKDRFATAKEMVEALSVAVTSVEEPPTITEVELPTLIPVVSPISEPSSPPTPSKEVETPTPSRRSLPWKIIGAAAGIVLLAMLSIWILSNLEPAEEEAPSVVALGTVSTETYPLTSTSDRGDHATRAVQTMLAKLTMQVSSTQEGNTKPPSFSSIPPTASTKTAVPQPSAGEMSVNPADGAEIVYIPAGEFLMGSDPDNDPHFWGPEYPSHIVYVDGFWLYRTEVTNDMYKACVRAESCTTPYTTGTYVAQSYYTSSSFSDYPVVNVTWHQANDYCEWAGGRLPLEAEWEKAARGEDARLFPWGNQTPSGSFVNLCDRNCPYEEERLTNMNDGYPTTAPVGSFPAGASPYELLDMSGNVWEWVADWYQVDYYQRSPERNPTGPVAGDEKVIRGGSWYNLIDAQRTVVRFKRIPGEFREMVGFRCAPVNP